MNRLWSWAALVFGMVYFILPLVGMATKAVLGHDCLESMPEVGEYLKLITARPSFQQVNADFRVAFAAHQAAQKSASS